MEGLEVGPLSPFADPAYDDRQRILEGPTRIHYRPHGLQGIVDQLVEKYPGKAREEMEAEVLSFLGRMQSRGLVQVEG